MTDDAPTPEPEPTAPFKLVKMLLCSVCRELVRETAPQTEVYEHVAPFDHDAEWAAIAAPVGELTGKYLTWKVGQKGAVPNVSMEASEGGVLTFENLEQRMEDPFMLPDVRFEWGPSFTAKACVAWEAGAEWTNYSGTIVRGFGTHHQYLVGLSGLGHIFLLDDLTLTPQQIAEAERIDVGTSGPALAPNKLNPRTAAALAVILAAVRAVDPRF